METWVTFLSRKENTDLNETIHRKDIPMFTFLIAWIAFTYGYIAAIKHADFLDKREQKRFLAATPKETRFDYADVEPTPVGPNPFVN